VPGFRAVDENEICLRSQDPAGAERPEIGGITGEEFLLRGCRTIIFARQLASAYLAGTLLYFTDHKLGSKDVDVVSAASRNPHFEL
jgi:hypothetical protein